MCTTAAAVRTTFVIGRGADAHVKPVVREHIEIENILLGFPRHHRVRSEGVVSDQPA
jgi:hypothetical protein